MTPRNKRNLGISAVLLSFFLLSISCYLKGEIILYL